MENEEVVVPETTEEVTPEVTAEETQEEEIDWRAKAEEERQARLKAEEIANNQKIRAEKAEKRSKESPRETVRESKDGMSSTDTIAIINAKVHEDDIERIQRYAKSEGISVKDALKTDELKAILRLKDEQRNTAEATNTSRTRSSGSRSSGDALLSKAQKTGEIPDSEDGLDAMLTARYAAKKK